MQNEFWKKQMILAGTLFVPAWYQFLKLPVVVARFPEKIAMSARLWGTRKMCPAGYKKAICEPVCVSQMVSSDCKYPMYCTFDLNRQLGF